MRLAPASLLLLALGCATDPLSVPPQPEVFFPGAGDDECSIPGWLDWLLEDRLPQQCCTGSHDSAYEWAKVSDPRPPEVERRLADGTLWLCCMYEAAHERADEWVCDAAYLGVRVGGWKTWYFGEPDPSGRVTDPWED